MADLWAELIQMVREDPSTSGAVAWVIGFPLLLLAGWLLSLWWGVPFMDAYSRMCDWAVKQMEREHEQRKK